MDDNSSKNIKIALVFLGVVLVLAVGYWIYTAIERSGKVAVDVMAAPGDANILVNDQAISSGTAYLKPGNYTVKATKEGFADFSSIITIENAPDQVIPVLMAPISEKAKKWAEENQDRYLSIEGEAGKAAQQKGDVFREKNPIVSRLPTDSLLFTIGYKSDPADPNGNSIILEIDAAEGYRQAAIYQITQWGYSPADYKINFRDYKNPFTL